MHFQPLGDKQTKKTHVTFNELKLTDMKSLIRRGCYLLLLKRVTLEFRVIEVHQELRVYLDDLDLPA